MSNDSWQQIEKIFYAALDYEGDERAAYLAQACAGDEALRQRVEKLIAADAEAEAQSFLASPLKQANKTPQS